MSYPFWQAGISYGWLMASIAVLHVFVSHFAIGGGLYLAVTEQRARAAQDSFRLEFLRRLSKVFVLATLVFGALSGVGIWFVIGLLNPAATEVLIHHFVWGWAIEWTFFLVEISSALIYWYGWDRLSPRNHLRIGWIYFVFAWLSLFIINGIITFMLTPGAWLETGSFWAGFFNPTAMPSLVFRTGICLLLAGVYALAVAAHLQAAAEKVRLIRYNGIWSLAGFALMIPSFLWYWHAIPAEIRSVAKLAMPIPIHAIHASLALLAALAVLLVVSALALPRRFGRIWAVLVLALSLAFFGEFEWFRESLRKPFVISGYMYGNGIALANVATYRADGYLAHMAYRTGDDGADLFARACASCHTLSGALALKPAFDGTDKAFIAAIIRAADLLKGHMPPFLGTAAEADMVAGYLYDRLDHRSLADIYALTGVALGRKVYAVRCGKCHVLGGFRDKIDSLAGLSDDDYNSLLDDAADLGEGMPAFTADLSERTALIEYLKTLKK